MQDVATQVSLANRALSRASQVLQGIITGIVADGHLHDAEIQLLSTWLTANEAVTGSWPGSAIARLVREALTDGRIDEAERAHLLTQLQAMAGSDFSETGSVEPEVAKLPYDVPAPALMPGMRVCLTGVFLYGTRNACEKLAVKVGLEPVSAVSRKVHALVVGAHVSPDWVNTSYGTKIIRAMELRDDGHAIHILRERDWLQALGA